MHVSAQEQELKDQEVFALQQKQGIHKVLQPSSHIADQFISPLFTVPPKRRRPQTSSESQGSKPDCRISTFQDGRGAHAQRSIETKGFLDQNRLQRCLLLTALFPVVCLPFGLNSAPRVFTKFLKPVVAQLRKIGITLIIYPDDVLIMSESKELQRVAEILETLYVI